MQRAMRLTSIPGIFLCLIGILSAREEPLSREAVAKRAKLGTVLVDAKPTYGSGFCIHSSGLFLTNEHVIHPNDRLAQQNTENLTLVVDAGLKTQKVLKAKILRRDKDLDLALLKVDSTDKFEAIELGSDKDLAELTEVVACGFPFGKALARKDEYPAISINVGSVTSLRRDKTGELHRIQLDAAVNPGNSGGPILDRSGKVVGMVVSGIQGAGINMAIPVSHLKTFLARPEIAFTLPTIKAANRHEPFEFTATTVSLLPSTDKPEKLEFELILEAGDGQVRRFPMQLTNGTYRAKAIPFPAREGPPLYRVEVKFEDGLVSGMAEDRTFRINEKEIKLSQLRYLRLGAKPEVRLVDGQRVEGKLVDLESIPVQVGKQPLKVNLANAKEINVEAIEEATAISCTVMTKLDGKEMKGVSLPLYIDGVSRPSLEALADGKFVKPPRSSTPVSYLRAVSSKGDYIGQGKNYSYESDEISPQMNPRGVTVHVGGIGGWTLNFGGPGKRFLESGEYRDAKRFPFSGESPGLEFYGFGRGANTLSGEFMVWEIEVKNNQVVRLAVDFIQRCEGKMLPLYGSLRINSTFH